MATTALRSDPTLRATLRIAMLGVGRWGSHLLRNLLQNSDVTIAAVIDPWIPNLKRSQNLFSPIAPANTQWLTDWQTALDTLELDAIVVATPAETHYPIIRVALIKGLHVLAEKPLTLTVAESIELCELAQKNNVQLVVDHTYLFNPAIACGRQSIENLGNLRYAYATRTHLAPVRQDVDALWDLAIHDIAILNYWLDDRPVRVTARGKSWLQRDIQTDLSPNGLADTIWATLEYANGFCADLHFSWLNCDKQRRMAVVGDRGTMIFDELAPKQLIIHYGELVKTEQGFSPDRQTQDVLPILDQEPLKLLCEHFVHCVKTNESSKISSGWLGANLVAVLVALSDSMNQNGAWISLDDRSHLEPHIVATGELTSLN